ncbi:ribosomal-protein-serine acetyltransferase [Cytobacillus purgationiresistens]|uniref:Ribosomal-protein-serine acetyltransferase n=1 Tax=Cytobacillus purgationiresistens TaxID=863449 RepID=A0ABU0AE23_9BACI|nr:GNAT family N-acetyltransferase [Cytobacillus purgationiresistens]MDQ0268986.1 ribosomal-protein-serine acetyltransferase [Cytobacillus purgationiresistens]
MFTLKVDNEIDLQLLQAHHANDFFHLIDSNRKHLREWLPWIDQTQSHAQCRYLIDMWQKMYTNHIGLNTAILFNGQLVGSISLHQIDWMNRQTNIGYFLGEQFQGNGIVIKSVKALMQYVLLELHLNRIEIKCGLNNNKSRSIPERLGFTKEGLMRDGELLNNRYHDLVVYSFLLSDLNK